MAKCNWQSLPSTWSVDIDLLDGECSSCEMLSQTYTLQHIEDQTWGYESVGLSIEFIIVGRHADPQATMTVTVHPCEMTYEYAMTGGDDLVSCCASNSLALQAQCCGILAGAYASDALGEGGIAWGISGNVDEAIVFRRDGILETEWLIASFASPSIPDDATITGLQFDYKRGYHNPTPTTAYDTDMIISIDGVDGDNVPIASPWEARVMGVNPPITVGGPNELFGHSPTPADINAGVTMRIRSVMDAPGVFANLQMTDPVLTVYATGCPGCEETEGCQMPAALVVVPSPEVLWMPVLPEIIDLGEF